MFDFTSKGGVNFKNCMFTQLFHETLPNIDHKYVDIMRESIKIIRTSLWEETTCIVMTYNFHNVICYIVYRGFLRAHF